MTQTPFQRALDGYEDAIFRLPAHRRRECIDRTLVHMRRTLPSDYRRTQRYEFRRLANDGTVCQHHAIVDAANALPAMRDRCVVSVAQAHHRRLWWLPFLLLWNSLTSGIDVFEYAVNWWLVQQRWFPRLARGPVIATLALICSDVRRMQASGSRVPSWCLAWQRAPVVGFKVCAWRIGWLQGWQWLRRKTEAPSPQDQPDYSFLPSALRVALAALALCAVLWPQQADAHVMLATITGAGAAFQVQTDGSDGNAGYFNAGGGSAGTDYSQQAAAQVTIDGATITATVHTTTTQLTIAGTTVASTWNRNGVRITGGTATAGLYEITAVDVPNNRITLDRSAGTSTQTATGAMGGALVSLGMAGGGVVAQVSVWVKAGTYTVSSASTNVTGGCYAPSANNTLEGYNATRGDLGTKPLLQAGSISTFTVVDAPDNTNVRNISIDCVTKTSARGLRAVRGSIYLVNVTSATNSAFANQTNTPVFVRCRATACVTTGAGFTLGGCSLFGCEADSGSVLGISAAGQIVYCLAYGNTGASTDGIQPTAAGTMVINATAYGNGRDGIRSGQANTSHWNCLSTVNGGYGMNGTTTYLVWVNCATYNNTSGGINGTSAAQCASIGAIALSADPFANAAGGDFSLNATSGGGAACRAAAILGAFPRGTTTGYMDLGAVQHQDSGGAAVPVIGGSIIRSATLWS